MRARANSWLPPIVYMAVIFGLSSESNPFPEVTVVVWDKLLHSVEYAGLAFLIARALRREGFNVLAIVAIAIVFTSVYGVTDEFHQWFVPGRDSTWRDWTADTVGATLGAAAYMTVFRRR